MSDGAAANKQDGGQPASNDPKPDATAGTEEEDETGVVRCHDCRNRSKKGCANDRCRQCCFRLETKSYVDCSVHPRGQVRKGTPSLRDFTGKLVFYRPPPPSMGGQPGYALPGHPGAPVAAYGVPPTHPTPGYAGPNSLPPPRQQYPQGPVYTTPGTSPGHVHGSTAAYYSPADPSGASGPGQGPPPMGGPPTQYPRAPLARWQHVPAPSSSQPQQHQSLPPPQQQQALPPQYSQSTVMTQSSSSAYNNTPTRSHPQPREPAYSSQPTTTTTSTNNNKNYMAYNPNNHTGPPPQEPRPFPTGPSHLPAYSYSSQPSHHYRPPGTVGGPAPGEFMHWGDPAHAQVLPQYSPILRTQHQHNAGIETSPQLRRGRPYGQTWHPGPPPTSPLYAGHRRARPAHEETTPSMNQGRAKRAYNMPDMVARQVNQEDEEELKNLDSLVGKT